MTPVGAQSYELIQSGEALRETILKDALDVSAEQLKVRRQQVRPTVSIRRQAGGWHIEHE
eukprot:22452-Eustigmatos_ZCMA.PRE.1